MDRKVRLAYEKIRADFEALVARNFFESIGPDGLLKQVKESAEAMWGGPCEVEWAGDGVINVKAALPTQYVTITLGGLRDE